MSIKTKQIGNANPLTDMSRGWRDIIADLAGLRRDVNQPRFTSQGTHSSTTVDLSPLVDLLEIDTTSNSVTVNLPAVSSLPYYRIFTIKDVGGNAGINAITINPNGSETIDGAANRLINGPYEAAKIYTNGTGWFIV